MAGKSYMKWDGKNSVARILLVFVVLFMFMPFLTHDLIVQAKHNARRASCESSMEQLGLAMLQYTQDSDGILPSYATVNGRGWREKIYPYIQSVGVYRCPDDQSNPWATPEHLPHSYGANAATMIGKANLVATPSILAADMRGYDGEEWNMTNPAFLPNTGYELYTHPPNHYFLQHLNGTLNLLFTDGHVKAMEPMATLTPTNLWTRDNAPFTGRDLANAQAILKHAESE